MNESTRKRERRRRNLIDKRTQFGIAKGLCLFWLTGVLVVICFPLFAMAVYGTLIALKPADEVFRSILDAAWYPLAISILVIPASVWYSIRFSNRIAGPVFHVKREMRKFSEGDAPRPVSLREGDFFVELAETWNACIARFEATSSQPDGSLPADATSGPNAIRETPADSSFDDPSSFNPGADNSPGPIVDLAGVNLGTPTDTNA